MVSKNTVQWSEGRSTHRIDIVIQVSNDLAELFLGLFM